MVGKTGMVPLILNPIYTFHSRYVFIGYIYDGSLFSGDNWMYPYQRTPMGIPYVSPIIPKNPIQEHQPKKKVHAR